MDDLWEERGQVLPDGDDQRARLEITAPMDDSQDAFEKYALTNMECNTLTKLFFSRQNRQEIQNRIRYEIYRQSRRKYIIGEQYNMELAMLMRSIYLQYAKNVNCKIQEQISGVKAKSKSKSKTPEKKDTIAKKTASKPESKEVKNK